MKLAVFDLDGTLVNSLEDLAEACNYALRTLGLAEHDLEKYNYFVGNGAKKLIERILPENAKDKQEQAFGLFNEYYNRNYSVKTYVYEGIKELLKKLKSNGVMLAVASNKPDNFTKTIISEYFGDDMFSAVYGKQENRPVKPDPAIINDIIKELSADKNECFMIGDTNIDIKTGKNAGVKTIGCLWGFRTEDELKEAGADFIVDKAEKIAEIIE